MTIRLADVEPVFGGRSCFPLGMYSAASYAMAAEIGQRSFLTVSLVLFWDASAAWLVVVVAGPQLLCRHR